MVAINTVIPRRLNSSNKLKSPRKVHRLNYPLVHLPIRVEVYAQSHAQYQRVAVLRQKFAEANSGLYYAILRSKDAIARVFASFGCIPAIINGNAIFHWYDLLINDNLDEPYHLRRRKWNFIFLTSGVISCPLNQILTRVGFFPSPIISLSNVLFLRLNAQLSHTSH